MKLTQAKIENYQSHRELILNFHPGINVIVGQSLNGKTAIFRSIEWPVQNRPSGFRFHSNFATKEYTRVTLSTDTGISVALKKTEKTASYTITNADGEETKFRKFSTSVPVEVTEALQFPVANIQNQLDQPYLITSSPGEITRAINDVTGLDHANEWVKKFSSVVTALQREIKFVSTDIKTLTDKLKKYVGMPRTEVLLNKAKTAHKKNEKLTETQGRLMLYKTAVQKVALRLRKLRSWNIDDLMESLNDVSSQKAALLREKRKWTELENIQSKIEILKTMDISDLIASLNTNGTKIDAFIIEENALIDLQETRERIEFLKQLDTSTILKELKLNLLYRVKFEIERAKLIHWQEVTAEIKKLTGHFKTLRQSYGTILYEIGKCPTCFTDIDEDTISHIHEEF